MELAQGGCNQAIPHRLSRSTPYLRRPAADRLSRLSRKFIRKIDQERPIAANTIVRYRRPEAPWSVTTMTISGDDEVVKLQIDRLIALGYAIVDAGQAPAIVSGKP